MKKTIINLYFTLSITFLATAQEEKKAKPNIYESCCGIKPVEFKIGDANVYIPNVFTPNDDGLNDLFFPFISDDIMEVQDYMIISANADTLIYSKSSFKYSEFEKYAWNGNRYFANGIKESEYVGLFKYYMRIVNAQGFQKIVEGEACVARNDADSKVFKQKKECFFADQADDDNDNVVGKVKGKGGNKGKGKVDKTKKTKEKEFN
jgi:hypothetical protein